MAKLFLSILFILIWILPQSSRAELCSNLDRDQRISNELLRHAGSPWLADMVQLVKEIRDTPNTQVKTVRQELIKKDLDYFLAILERARPTESKFKALWQKFKNPHRQSPTFENRRQALLQFYGQHIRGHEKVSAFHYDFFVFGLRELIFFPEKQQTIVEALEVLEKNQTDPRYLLGRNGWRTLGLLSDLPMNIPSRMAPHPIKLLDALSFGIFPRVFYDQMRTADGDKLDSVQNFEHDNGHFLYTAAPKFNHQIAIFYSGNSDRFFADFRRLRLNMYEYKEHFKLSPVEWTAMNLVLFEQIFESVGTFSAPISDPSWATDLAASRIYQKVLKGDITKVFPKGSSGPEILRAFQNLPKEFERFESFNKTRNLP